MKIKQIFVKNFKSFDEANIELSNFNVIVGSNASGKSNFVSIFKFINDIQVYGFDNAISLQGGIKYLCNSEIGANHSIKIEFYSENNMDKSKYVNDIFLNNREIRLENFQYKLKITPSIRLDKYKLIEEELNVEVRCASSKEEKQRLKFYRKNNRPVKYEFSENIDKELKENISLIMKVDFFRKTDYSLLVLLKFLFLSVGINENSMKFYDFNVNLLKSPASIATKLDLQEDGSNLANVVQKILKDKNEKARLNRIVKSILPFIKDIQIENSINKSLIFKVRESYHNKEYPSHLLSDGTVNILAIMIALYFQKAQEFIVIEEPEKNIHPGLLKSICEMLDDVSKNKQIIITTHNPQMLKTVDLKNIYFIKRDIKGFSKITKPSNSKGVSIFLKNNLGIDDLFIKGLLNE